MSQSFAIVESAASPGYHVAEFSGKRLKRSAPLAYSDRMLSTTGHCQEALNRHAPAPPASSRRASLSWPTWEITDDHARRMLKSDATLDNLPKGGQGMGTPDPALPTGMYHPLRLRSPHRLRR